MNAINFIKDHGVEKARGVVKSAPEWASEYCMESNDYINYCDADNVGHCDSCISISDLERLIESVDLIESNGGYESIKDTFNFAWAHRADELTEYGERLKQAIADYEKIFRGEHV